MTRRVLVIGGTGAFGARLVEGLLVTTELCVTIGARDLARSAKLADALRKRYPARTVETAAIDAEVLDAAALRRLAAWCVVDAAGPFQDAPPRVAQAAIDAGCHYIDLADARDFVGRFCTLDAAARAAGVVAVSGASSTPALSNAALDRLTRNFQRIDRVEIAISPGNRAPRGRSVVRAILARAGQPVRVFRGGGWMVATGWGLLVRRRMPGLGRRWLSLVETPDLDVLPQRFSPRDAAIFRAGLELSVMHLGLWLLSRLVRVRVLRSLTPLTAPLQWIAERLRPLGTDRGGMMVIAEGIDGTGTAVRKTWALIAFAGDGPSIPTLPALALIRALDSGRSFPAGAHVCAGLLSLADIEVEFGRFRIVTRTFSQPRALFHRVLPHTFARMPEAIRLGHSVDASLTLSGRASIEGARGILGRVAARVFGFPAESPDMPVRVEMRADGEEEVWTRIFGTHRFSSRLGAGRGCIHERFGPVTCLLSPTADASGLVLKVKSARMGPVPLPRFLTPRSTAYERVDDRGRFTFDVPIALPGIGQIVRYRGWLVPDAPQ